MTQCRKICQQNLFTHVNERPQQGSYPEKPRARAGSCLPQPHHTCTHNFIHTGSYTYSHVLTLIHIHLYSHRLIHILPLAHMYTLLYTDSDTHAHTLAHICTGSHTHPHTHTRAHIHTHTPACAHSSTLTQASPSS